MAASSDLLGLLLDARKPHPPAKWLDRWRDLRDRLDRQRLRGLLLELAEAGNAKMGGLGPEAGDPTVLVARGALWALADFQDDATRDYLVRTVLAWSRSSVGTPALGGAAIWALARPADEQAVRHLLALKSKISHKFLRTRLEEAIVAISTASGFSPDEIADRQVPDHGLDRRGQRAWNLQGYLVTLTMAPNGVLVREILDPEGRTCKTIPSGVRQACVDAWSEITRETKDLRTTLSAQRARMEDAMICGRIWTADSWKEVIAGHPILSSLGRRLVWQVKLPAAEERQYAMPVDGGWRDARGEPVEIADDASLTIAHPLSMPDDVRERWQRRIVDERIVQPFKQLFRETYVVTPVEVEAPYASTRFAGLPVSMRQIYALARTRGWSGPLGQTYFDGAGEGYREFSSYKVRAVLRHSVDLHALATVETVHFERNLAAAGARRKTWNPIPLRDVPPIPLSEAMRDVDLIVSVATVGNEAQWREWEVARAAERDAAAHERSSIETCESRAALLRAILPLLGVREQVEIRGHFAFVRGQRGAYRVHLGTGNIHLEPSGRYLCIVPAPERDGLFLPFEGDDRKTSEIISKIVLLARDSSIRDPSVLRQLPSG